MTMAPVSHQPQTLAEALISLQQQQADIERLHQAHEAWMRAVAHDLRAPLRHVVSFAPLLRESVEELAAGAPQLVEAAEDAREFAATMEQSARKMSAMLDGMTHVSRAARAVLAVGAVDLVALTQHVVQALQAAHPLVQWQLPQGSALVLADASSLQQLVEAVLGNAVKFSAKQAQPQITVRVQQVAGGNWQWQVQDNGVGFDSQRAQALGQLFQRMHRDADFEGVGCGLALVDVVARRHAAQWQVQAQPQEGCTFTLVWPGIA